MALYYAGGLLNTPMRSAPFRTRRPIPTSGSSPGSKRPSTSPIPRRNRSAAIRIPTYSQSPKSKRLEYRPPDPAANPYLASRRVAHGRPRWRPEQNQTRRSARQEHLRAAARGTEEGAERRRAALSEALDCLEKDHAFHAQGRCLHRGFH